MDAAPKQDMLSVEEAREQILAEIDPLGSERIALSEALGRVLSEAVVASTFIPPTDNTAMDGYAVHAADVASASADEPVTLKVVETIPAGYVPQRRVERGEASRIMTGATIPEGADSIVIVEQTEGDGDRVRVLKPANAGANIRRRGEDVRPGQTVVEAGATLGPGEIGLLASVRRAFVAVSRRPRVAIVSTGDELVDVDVEPGPGQIVNSNAFSLAALARQAGAESMVLPIVRDSIDETVAALRRAAAADAVVTSGGVSVGEFDFVKAALDALGADTKFWRVRMKPGKPVVFAKLLGVPFFGLPGNPVSCMVAFHLFVRPALRKATGVAEGRLLPTEIEAELANDVRSTGDRRNYLRAVVRPEGGRLVAATKPAQGSGVLSSMVGANGLVVVPEGTREIAAGSRVAVLLIGEM